MRLALLAKRVERNLTQEQVAKALNISRPTYTKIENGHTEPSLALALRIASFFNAPVEELFADVKSPMREVS